ncbi:MAG TPA: hypothetical protein VFR07_16360, partial [Mycobacteriales bacterium]|nr:hypothetical protein [Mycobacteriales bacterium]
MPEHRPGPTGPRAELLLPFRPRRTRVVAWALAATMAVLVGLIVLLSPGRFGPADAVGFGVLGLLVVVGLWRQAAVKAVPSEQGLAVRNLFLGRDLAWAEIVSVR